MSLTRRVRTGRGGEPILVIEVRGVDDVYRLARHLELGQCEFADLAVKVLRWQKRKLGRATWSWLLRRMHGPTGIPRDGGFR